MSPFLKVKVLNNVPYFFYFLIPRFLYDPSLPLGKVDFSPIILYVIC